LLKLTSQKDLRSVHKLDFCYLCGNGFNKDSERSKDHIPPQAIFDKQDRNFPLILLAHRSCNGARSPEDEVIGQLVSLLHGRVPAPHRNRLAVEVRTDTEHAHELGIFTGLKIEAVIQRWLKGFHAALYKTPLSDATRFATQTPFPSGTLKNGSVIANPIPPQHCLFVEELKRNRLAGSLDTIVCNNGKLRYECVWVQMDDGGWGCIYGIDLYGWKNLGDIHNFPARGCAGLYRTENARFPPGSATSTRLAFTVENKDPLDPFAS